MVFIHNLIQFAHIERFTILRLSWRKGGITCTECNEYIISWSRSYERSGSNVVTTQWKGFFFNLEDSLCKPRAYIRAQRQRPE